MIHARSLVTRLFKKQSSELLSFHSPVRNGRSASNIVPRAVTRGYATRIKFPNRKGLEITESEESLRHKPKKVYPDKNQGSLIIDYESGGLESIKAFRSETSAIVNDSNMQCPSPVTYRFTGISDGDKKLLEAAHYETFHARNDLRFILFDTPDKDILEGDTFDIREVKPMRNRFDVVMKKKKKKKEQEEGEEESDEGVKLCTEVKCQTFAYCLLWEAGAAKKRTSITNEKAGQERTGEAYFKKEAMVALRHKSDGESIGDYSVSVPPNVIEWMETAVKCEYRHIVTEGCKPPMKAHYLVGFLVNLHFIPVSHSIQAISSQIPDKYRDELPVIPAGAVAIKMESLPFSRHWEVQSRLNNYGLYKHDKGKTLMDLLPFGLLYQLYVTANRNGTITDEDFDGRVGAHVQLKTLDDIGLPSSRLLDVIYEKNLSERQHSEKIVKAEVDTVTVPRKNGGETSLNLQQSRAVRLFEDKSVRALCVQSPPGSGKTTVAAVMAVRSDGPMVVTSMQNVAVDAVGESIKKMDYLGTVYNMKSIAKLDPDRPAPFDFFDHQDESELQVWKDRKREAVRDEEDWKGKKDELMRMKTRDGVTEEEVRMLEMEVKSLEVSMDSYDTSLKEAKRRFEQDLLENPHVMLLMTVQMALTLMNSEGHWRDTLGRMQNVIIDEASMLPEAALVCLLGRIPDAKYVFIGDGKQLPPFMYDSRVLGHQLANRSAISVLTKTARIPVIQLNEVYRAPPRLIKPYSERFYEGKLVSKKEEKDFPLSDSGLVPKGSPQLLFENVEGTEMKSDTNSSWSNEKEVEALKRLLSALTPGFPNTVSDRAKKEILVICLYKDQMTRVRDELGPGWAVHTVDSAQGKEASIVFILTTRTSLPGQQEFFNSPNRCNVAVSRARSATVILGHQKTLEKNSTYWDIIRHGFVIRDSDKLVEKVAYK